MNAPVSVRIDFVSDIACPWCAIGLASLQQALTRLEGSVRADIHVQPFELEPELPAEGVESNAHLIRKYNIDETQLEANRKIVRNRAAALGVVINTGRGSRDYNTFDAHRLLHWAEVQNPERVLPLKQALFRAYFADDENVADRGVLVRIAESVGLDSDAAREALASGAYGDEVRAQERYYQQAGIHAVPATIVNNKHVISGGQPPEVFERALRQIVTDRPHAT
ncbi:MAG: DsbA family oxidoreductase [Gammaproteobacteria bacterium]